MAAGWLRRESASMQSHLSEIEAGKRNATVDLVGAVALALGVRVAMLFDEGRDTADHP